MYGAKCHKNRIDIKVLPSIFLFDMYHSKLHVKKKYKKKHLRHQQWHKKRKYYTYDYKLNKR